MRLEIAHHLMSRFSAWKEFPTMCCKPTTNVLLPNFTKLKQNDVQQQETLALVLQQVAK
jgi:hypothetical protein